MDEAIPPKFLNLLAGSILEESTNFEWEGYLRLEKQWSDSSFVKKLAQSGFRKAYFGLELLEDNKRSTLNKKDSPAQMDEVLRIANDSGIKVHLFCMFGFPETGRREAEKTLEFVLRNQDLIDTVDLNPFTYARHTHVNGITRVENLGDDWALEYDYQPIDSTSGILSSEQVDQLTMELEEVVWEECPRLLHPIYRLWTPWSDHSPHMEEPIALAASC
jgi:hypothetical protein